MQLALWALRILSVLHVINNYYEKSNTTNRAILLNGVIDFQQLVESISPFIFKKTQEY